MGAWLVAYPTHSVAHLKLLVICFTFFFLRGVDGKVFDPQHTMSIHRLVYQQHVAPEIPFLIFNACLSTLQHSNLRKTAIKKMQASILPDRKEM